MYVEHAHTHIFIYTVIESKTCAKQMLHSTVLCVRVRHPNSYNVYQAFAAPGLEGANTNIAEVLHGDAYGILIVSYDKARLSNT